jgi:hypothetical protein
MDRWKMDEWNNGKMDENAAERLLCLLVLTPLNKIYLVLRRVTKNEEIYNHIFRSG